MKKLIGILLFSIICFGTSLAGTGQHKKKGDHVVKTGCDCKKQAQKAQKVAIELTKVTFSEVKEGEKYFLVWNPVEGTDKEYVKGSDDADDLTDDSIVYVHKEEEQKV